MIPFQSDKKRQNYADGIYFSNTVPDMLKGGEAASSKNGSPPCFSSRIVLLQPKYSLCTFFPKIHFFKALFRQKEAFSRNSSNAKLFVFVNTYILTYNMHKI